MGKPLSRPGCFRKSSCCLEKHRVGEGGGGRGGAEGGYGDGYIPQRSIYDTMCINQQIDSHHYHSGGSTQREGGGGGIGEGTYNYSASGSLRVSRPSGDMFEPRPRSLTPNPSFVRRLDERAIFDSLKLGGQAEEGVGCHSPGHFNRSVSPSVSSFSAPGVSSSASKKHHHQHHHYHLHGDSTKSRDGRHSWKVLTPPKHLECLELSTGDMLERGGGYLNPGLYPPPGGNSSSLTSPLLSPFSGSPLSSGYHTPVFFSPAKPRPAQTQSLRCSPPHVVQARHYSQTQSLRLSPPHELRRSPYRAPLVQLSARDLQEDLRDRGWGRAEREREWERERERDMERGWAEREWEREKERARLERERARERERRDTSVSSFGTFGYGRAVPLCSDRDSVFLETEQMLDTTPLLLPQPTSSPIPNAAPRMGTGAVGRNRAGSKVGPETVGSSTTSKYENGTRGVVVADGGGPRVGNEFGCGNILEAGDWPGIKAETGAGTWTKNENWAGASIKNEDGAATVTGNGTAAGIGSQIKTGPEGCSSEVKVLSGTKVENGTSAVNKEGPSGGLKVADRTVGGTPKSQPNAEANPSAVVKAENRVGSGAKDDFRVGSGAGTKVDTEALVGAIISLRQTDVIGNSSGVEAGGLNKVNKEVGAGGESKSKMKTETVMRTDPIVGLDAGIEAGAGSITGTRSKAENEAVNETQKSTENIMNNGQTNTESKSKVETTAVDKAEIKTMDKIEFSQINNGSSPMGKGSSPIDKDSIPKDKVSRAQYSRASGSKPSSRIRPGTATGLRPGVVSPRADTEFEGPPEGMESTWPRRIIVRKRTVRQGGELHNLPILPPLPSVLSALEKRHPHPRLLHHPIHFSENPLTSVTNPMPTSLVGRCSLKEPSHLELVHGAGLVGRASLKEQNLEQWRVSRDPEETRRVKTKENQGEQRQEYEDGEERKRKEERREKERGENKQKGENDNLGEDRSYNLDKNEKEREEAICTLVVDGGKQEKVERGIVEETVQENANRKYRVEKAEVGEVKGKEDENREMKREEQTQGAPRKGEEKMTALTEREAELDQGEGGEEGTNIEEGEIESWDAVLEMVNTLWDDGWSREGAGGGDTDSVSGSLHRWPLLRPPSGFGGSHPPSSAASELSLTELEKRAKELDSDLEHLDLSQTQREAKDLYQEFSEPQRERGEMYQTHPGPQREKVTLLTGVRRRSQISLDLNNSASPPAETDRPPTGNDWSNKPAAGASAVGTSSVKEDSSPESNLTLESESSGVFLSLSNQSQEEVSSDSDQPLSGSDLGSSSTSLERDGEEAGSKEWGREESAELQWCYPSLLNTSSQGEGEEEEEGVGGGEREEEECGKTEQVGIMEQEKQVGRETEGGMNKRGTVTIVQASLDPPDIQGSTTLDTPQGEEIESRKRVTLTGTDSPLPLSPSKQPIQQLLGPTQPIRSSGLDCSDLDPFVQSDSFVYLAVSTGPTSRAAMTTAIDVPVHETHPDSAHKRSDSSHARSDPSSRDTKLTGLALQQPEEGDFLSTDSFVYLAAPACLLLGPEGTAPYSNRESDSDSSGSGPVDLSVLGCGSIVGDSDWDSDLSDCDPHRSSRTAGTSNKTHGTSRPRCPSPEPGWDLFGDTTEQEVLTELFTETDKNNKSRTVTGVTTPVTTAPGVPMATHPVTVTTKAAAKVEQTPTTKKVTWQFKPAQRSVCTGSRKEKGKDVTSASAMYTDLGGGEMHRPSPSSSSSSSSSPSSSSSG